MKYCTSYVNFLTFIFLIFKLILQQLKYLILQNINEFIHVRMWYPGVQ